VPLTLRDVLALEAVLAGQPVVVAAADRLDSPVRWVHAAELSDVGRLLRGGELVLSTGIALPSSAAGLASYVASLAGAGVAGLAIELGQRYLGSLPTALVTAADERGVPLIAFEREVPFVGITEAVHARIIDGERAAATSALSRLLARQAESVERQAHRTLLSAIFYEDAEPAAATARAQAMGVPVTGRQLVALVARMPGAAPGLSGQALVLGIAEALADLCRGLRVPALVAPLDDARVGALLSLPAHDDSDLVLREAGARLAAIRHTGRDAASQSVAAGDSPAAAGPPAAPVIGVGSPAAGMAEVRRSFLDAREVADVALRHPDGRPYYRLPDLRLRGLLHMLRDDLRLTAFADRELGPLLAYDGAHGTRLAADLATYLEVGGNKAAAAARAHLARPTFYQRLQLIEHVLGVSLDDAESRASLHVAMLALRLAGDDGHADSPTPRNRA
jgi:purine catabolism regulator